MEREVISSNGNRKVIHYSVDGMFYFEGDSPYVDWNGNPVKRTPDKYRYSYDAYVQHKIADEYQHAVYSDRLWEWDSKKHDEFCEKHFGNKGQYWSGRGAEKIEAFLRDYYNKPDLKLIGIMEGCNVSSGYPYWVFMFNCEF